MFKKILVFIESWTFTISCIMSFALSYLYVELSKKYSGTESEVIETIFSTLKCVITVKFIDESNVAQACYLVTLVFIVYQICFFITIIFVLRRLNSHSFNTKRKKYLYIGITILVSLVCILCFLDVFVLTILTLLASTGFQPFIMHSLS